MMSAKHQEIAAATGMYADVLSIISAYEWKPFKDLKIKFVPSGQRRGHLIEDTQHFDGSNITLEKIPVNVADLSNPLRLSQAKRRKVMYYLLDMKNKTMPSTLTGQEVHTRLTVFMTDLISEYPADGAFTLRPRNCRQCVISAPLLKAVCDWIIKTIQLTQPVFRLN
jgi:hypothetical protein